MKITLNLAVLPSRRERYAFAWAIPLALVSAAGFVFLGGHALANIHQYRDMQAGIVRLEEQSRQLSHQEEDLKRIVGQPQYQTVSSEAQYVNSLIEDKKLSVADLVLKVSKLMPASVHLTGLSLARGRGTTVQFAVVGRDEQSLESFLTALEDSSDFQDISVENEGFQSGDDPSTPVTITCTAQYMGDVLH